ncbi:MAG: hypothetical protein AAGD38_13155 [Acidobacteriota bacterium]
MAKIKTLELQGIFDARDDRDYVEIVGDGRVIADVSLVDGRPLLTVFSSTDHLELDLADFAAILQRVVDSPPLPGAR